MKLQEVIDRNQWDRFVNGHPDGHPLQLWGWGEVKRQNGWTPERLAVFEEGSITGAAQILFWPIPRYGKKVAYSPRGPIMQSSEKKAIFTTLADVAKQHNALYLKVEPQTKEFPDMPGWRKSSLPTLLPQTYTIDLTKSEDELMDAMARKHRQYIRKSERDGVEVVECTHPVEHLGAFQRIYEDTANRAGFGLHAPEYYKTIAAELGANSHIYYALVDGRAEAVLWLLAAGQTAFELYGGVTERGGDRKANYALKWHAITDMKQRGCKIYDFNGRLNEGVGQFKAGFGPDATDWAGSYDLPFDKIGYAAWTKLFPVLKPVGRRLMRRRG